MMCISHLVTEGQRHNNPLNPRCFCLQQLLTYAIVEGAKALGGSCKLVTLAPKTVREMTQLPRETKGWEHKQIKETQMNTQNTNLG